MSNIRGKNAIPNCEGCRYELEEMVPQRLEEGEYIIIDDIKTEHPFFVNIGWYTGDEYATSELGRRAAMFINEPEAYQWEFARLKAQNEDKASEDDCSIAGGNSAT